SIVAIEAGGAGKSGSIEAHTKTESLLFHHADLDENEKSAKEDEWIDLTDEPDHNELRKREQQYFLRSIQDNLDLSDHMEDAFNSLRIAFAYDESVKTGEVVKL